MNSGALTLMIVSIKKLGGHDGRGESCLAPATQRAAEGVGVGAVRGAWGVRGEGGDVTRFEREHRARLAQARGRARCRCCGAAPASAIMPAQPATGVLQFVPVSLTPTPSAPTPGDIQIELRRGATAVKITWPIAAAADCAAWMRELLR